MLSFQLLKNLVVLCNRRCISHSLFLIGLKCKKRKKFIKDWSLKRQLGNFVKVLFSVKLSEDKIKTFFQVLILLLTVTHLCDP